jgi:hypothetical protein
MVYKITAKEAGVPTPGLTPTFLTFAKVSNGASVAPPAISAIAGGGYKFTYAPTEEIYVEIDLGSAIANADRYPSGVLELTDGLVPTSLTGVLEGSTSLGEALRMFLAAFTGDWECDTDTGAFTFKALDGTTVRIGGISSTSSRQVTTRVGT